MKKEAINPPSVFRSLEHGFSQAVVAGGGRTLYMSGQTAWDSQKQIIGGADLERQATQPASTWVGVASLADPGFLIEVEATAVFD